MAQTSFGPDAAGTWRGAVVSPVPRWATLAVGITGIVAGIAGTPESTCTALDPCTPLTLDLFGVLIGLLGLSFLGLWLWPTAGAALGIGAAVLDVVYDSSLPGRLLFAAYAVACLHLLGALRRSRRTQRAVVEGVATEVVVATHVPVVASGRGVWSAWLWLGAGFGTLVAIVAFASFSEAKASDAVHRDRAVKATGTVTSGSDDDLLQRVSLDHGGLPEEVRVSGSWELPRGSRIQLLVDPTDPTWTEIPTDPHDPSPWLSLGIFAAGLGGGALGLIGMRRWIETRHLTEGVGVQVAVSPDGRALLRPANGGKPFASFVTGAPAPHWGSGRLRRRIDWLPAVVVGDLRDWGWAKVFTPTGVVLPATPLRTLPEDGGESGLGDVPGAASVVRRWRSVADRLPAGREVGAVLLGLLLAGVHVPMLPDAMVVAQGGGVPGTVTITSESCSKSCSYSGDFRSSDGVHVFRDVFFAGSGEIGSTWPAVYVGSGEVPEEVYEPGNSTLRFNGFFTLVGLGVAGYPFVRRFLDAPTRPKRNT